MDSRFDLADNSERNSNTSEKIVLDTGLDHPLQGNPINGASAETLQKHGVLPHFSLSGLESTVTHAAKSIEHFAANVANSVKAGAEDVINTAENIPAADWLVMGGAGLQVLEKDGSGLALDGLAVAGTKGTSILADAKLVHDIYHTAISTEGRNFGHAVAQAWEDGQQNSRNRSQTAK